MKISLNTIGKNKEPYCTKGALIKNLGALSELYRICHYSVIGRDCRAEQVENDQTLSQSNISLEKMML